MFSKTNCVVSFFFALSFAVANAQGQNEVVADSLQKANSLVEEMKAQGLKVGVVTYGYLIELYKHARQADELFEVYRTMKQLGIRPTKHILHSVSELTSSELKEVSSI